MKKWIVLVLLLFFVSAGYSATDAKIGKWIKAHEEEGYKFVKTIGKTMWQVQFKMKDWKYSWNVYTEVSPNSSYPDFNILYIFTTIATTSGKPSSSLMSFILKLNEKTANWGSFSIKEYKDGDWEVHYMVKLRQNSVDSETLINAIGFVAGYANSMYEEIEEKAK